MELDLDEWPLDHAGFLPAIQSKPEMVRQGYELGTAQGGSLQPRGLLFAGMGFSGITGELIQDAVARVLDIPITIVKHYQLPRHVKPNWQVLAISYSGETEETLHVANQAMHRGTPVTCFTTGGRLAELGSLVPQPPDFQPRAALAFTWWSVLGWMQANDLIPEAPMQRARRAVMDADAVAGPQVPEAKNPAKQLARQLYQKIPQIYATPSFYGVGQHFRGMLNENAKKIADVDLVPECNHNDFTGWSEDPLREHFVAVALSHQLQHPEIQRRLEFMQERYTSWGVPWFHHQRPAIGSYEDHLVQQAGAIQFLDYVSFYTAMLRQVDPSEIREIRALKDHLRQPRK